MAAVWVAACLPQDVDAVTGTCAAVVWVPQPSMLPELTIEGGLAISVATATLWGLAFAFRLVRKKLNQS